MSCKHLVRCLGLTLGLSACGTTSESASTSLPSANWGQLPEPALYARDGSPVAPQSPARETPRHEVGARDGTRMYLLERYQKVVEDKESLARELEARDAALLSAGEVQGALTKQLDEARSRAQQLEAELANARKENTDLAARLVTAQIRRLEAEKLLLEARIEALRASRAPSDAESSARESGAPALRTNE